MKLSAFVSQHKLALKDAWFRQAISVFPKGMHAFIGTSVTSFGNPIGQSLSHDLDAFLSGLSEGEPPSSLVSRLATTIKVLSIQDVPPSSALSFISDIKTLLINRHRLSTGEDLDGETKDEWVRFIDATLLFAFDLYVKERDLLAEVRVNDIKRRVLGVWSRVARSEEELQDDDASKGSFTRVHGRGRAPSPERNEP